MRSSITKAYLAAILISLGLFFAVFAAEYMGLITPALIGCALVYLALRPGRIATLVFGHTCIILGAYLIGWGILERSDSEPIVANVFEGPLFWGIFSLMGGIRAIFHGIRRCVTKQVSEFEVGNNLKPTEAGTFMMSTVRSVLLSGFDIVVSKERLVHSKPGKDIRSAEEDRK